MNNQNKGLRERFKKYLHEHHLGFITSPHSENVIKFINQEVEKARQEGYSEGHHQGYKEGAMERL